MKQFEEMTRTEAIAALRAMKQCLEHAIIAVGYGYDECCAVSDEAEHVLDEYPCEQLINNFDEWYHRNDKPDEEVISDEWPTNVMEGME